MRGWEAAVGQPRYGPNGAAIVALLERLGVLTDREAKALASSGTLDRLGDEPWPPDMSPEDEDGLRVSAELAAIDAATAVVAPSLDARGPGPGPPRRGPLRPPARPAAPVRRPRVRSGDGAVAALARPAAAQAVHARASGPLDRAARAFARTARCAMLGPMDPWALAFALAAIVAVVAVVAARRATARATAAERRPRGRVGRAWSTPPPSAGSRAMPWPTRSTRASSTSRRTCTSVRANPAAHA